MDEANEYSSATLDGTQYIADMIALRLEELPGFQVSIAINPGCPKCGSIGIVRIESTLPHQESWGRCLRCMHFWESSNV